VVGPLSGNDCNISAQRPEPVEKVLTNSYELITGVVD